MIGSRRRLCHFAGQWWPARGDGDTVIRFDLRVADGMLRRNNTPRCEVDASRRGLTFGSVTSLGPTSRISPFFSQASPSVLPRASLPIERVRATFPASASARAILQRILSAGCPPVVAVAGQSTLSRQRSGSMPPPRAISALAHPRRRAALLRVGGRMPARGLSQGRGQQRFLLPAAGLLRMLYS